MKTSCRKRGRPPTYDWDRLFALGLFSLRKGVDYWHSVVSMAQQVRQAASKRKLPIHLVESDDVLIVTVKGVNHANGK